jgi:uncharacterized membrane protein YfcA
LSLFDIAAFAVIGLLTGFFGGLLGIGGGSITVPLLFFVMNSWGLSDTDLMHIVIGTTFASMVFNSALAVYSHHRKTRMPWKFFLVFLPGMILGPIIGSYVSTELAGPTLRFAFGIFQVLMAIYFLMPHHKRVEVTEEKKPNHFLLNITAFTVGGIGSVLGIGGGILMVPFLDMMGLSMKKAILIGSMTSCTVAIVSSASFLLLGLNTPVELAYSVGFIYLPAFIIIGLFSIVTIPLGVHLAHRIPVLPLKRIFASALAILGILLILK